MKRSLLTLLMIGLTLLVQGHKVLSRCDGDSAAIERILTHSDCTILHLISVFCVAMA
jgi:hypothetical protein